MTLTWTELKPAWRWAWTLSAQNCSKRRQVAVRRNVRFRHGRRGGLLVVAPRDRLDREVALGDPVAAQLLLDHLAEGVDADLVDEHLDPRPGAVDAQELLAVEDPKAGLGDLQVLAVVEADELVQRRRDARHDRRAAADAHLDAAHAVALAGEVGDVVDAGQRAVGGRAVERGLDLARHHLRRRVAYEVAHVGAGVGRQVEQLVLGDAGPRVPGHVAHGVAAALARGQAGVRQLADRLRGVGQRDVVQLDVLTRRDVPLVERHVRLDHVGEGVHLVGRDAAEGELDADHLDGGLALPVDALLETELDELRLFDVAAQVARRLRVEVVELTLDDRDDVAGDVLANLGVLERSSATADRCGLHGRSQCSVMACRASGDNTA